MVTLQFPSVPQGSTNNWDVPLKSDITALNVDLVSLAAAVAALTGTSTSPFGAMINVKNFGATGNGSTDDSAAIAAARDAVIAVKNPQGVCANILYFPAGKYRVTVPETLMFTPDVATGVAMTRVNSFTIMGDGKRKSQIFYDNNTTPAVGRHPADTALFVAGNRVNQLRVSNISFSSTNPANTCFFFWSRIGDGTGTGGAYPEYGTGNNQDMIFEDVEFSGNWRWCMLFDGDITCNLNSEVFCQNIAIQASSVFASNGAFFQCGFTNFVGNDQQDQMVNYTFRDCKIEYKSGIAFCFNRGGNVTFDGGSWINGIADDTAKSYSCFFRTNDVTLHNAGCLNAIFRGIRFELRNSNCKTFDVSGWYGAGAHITMENCTDTGHSFTADGPLTAHATFNTHNGVLPYVRVVNSALGGYWQILGAQTGLGRICFVQTGHYNWKVAVGTTAAANSFLRYNTATVPKYSYQFCEIADSAN